MASAGELPWSDLKVAFPINDPDAAWKLDDRKPWPGGWQMTETDSTGARAVAIFRVNGVPSVPDAEAISRMLKEKC